MNENYSTLFAIIDRGTMDRLIGTPHEGGKATNNELATLSQVALESA